MLCNFTVFYIFPSKEERKRLIWKNTLLANHFIGASSFPMVSATVILHCIQRAGVSFNSLGIRRSEGLIPSNCSFPQRGLQSLSQSEI